MGTLTVANQLTASIPTSILMYIWKCPASCQVVIGYCCCCDISKVTRSHPKRDNDIEFSVD